MTRFCSMEKFFSELCKWSEETFGDRQSRGSEGPIKHLKKECDEVLREIENLKKFNETFMEDEITSEKIQEYSNTKEKLKEEIVDLLFLVFDSANREYISFNELVLLAFKKLEKNKKRTWPKPTNTNEPIEHERKEK